MKKFFQVFAVVLAVVIFCAPFTLMFMPATGPNYLANGWVVAIGVAVWLIVPIALCVIADCLVGYTPVCSDYAPVVLVPAVELVHEMILVQHESGKMPIEFDCLPGQAQEMSDFLNDLGYFTFVADGPEYQEIWKRLSANRVYGKVFYAPGADTCAICGGTQDLVVDGYLPVNSRLCSRCARRHFDLVEKDLETFRGIATSI